MQCLKWLISALESKSQGPEALLQGVVGEGIGAAHITFAPGSEETCQLMRVLVIHMVPPVMPACPAKGKSRASRLSAQAEVCCPCQMHVVWHMNVAWAFSSQQSAIDYGPKAAQIISCHAITLNTTSFCSYLAGMQHFS